MHAKGSKSVTVYFERHVKSHGRWTWAGLKHFHATNGSVKSSATTWSVRAKLTTKGSWRAWAYHKDALHLASKSSYRYLTVK